jgi:hypothetical protein
VCRATGAGQTTANLLSGLTCATLVAGAGLVAYWLIARRASRPLTTRRDIDVTSDVAVPFGDGGCGRRRLDIDKVAGEANRTDRAGGPAIDLPPAACSPSQPADEDSEQTETRNNARARTPPVFARIYTKIGERRGGAQHRRKLLADLGGWVFEIGPNFSHYLTIRQ